MNIPIKPILYFLVVFSGSSSTITNKIIFSTISLGKKFTHPLLNNLIMFLAESTGIITFNLFFKEEEKKIFELPKNIGKTPIETYILAIPAILDLISSLFNSLSLDFLPGSLSRMFHGFSIIFTFFLSIFFLNNKHSIHNCIGIVIIIVGIFLLGLSEFTDTSNSKKESTEHLFFGIFFNIISNFFSSLHDISQEYFIKKQICHPIKCIGFEGFYGFILTFIFILISINVKCSNKIIRGKNIESSISDILINEVCIVDEKGNSFIENVSFIWKQIINNQNIFIYYVFLFFILIMLNYSYVGFIQISNAISRVVLTNITSLIVWIFFLIPIHNGKSYQERFKIIQFIGFLVLVFGVFYYNELIFNKNKDSENEIEEKITQNLGSEVNIPMSSINS